MGTGSDRRLGETRKVRSVRSRGSWGDWELTRIHIVNEDANERLFGGFNDNDFGGGEPAAVDTEAAWLDEQEGVAEAIYLHHGFR